MSDDGGPLVPLASRTATLDPALERRLPNVIIVGVMKCGTTSLHYYLGLHPQISMSREKEIEFFIEERNWSRGPAWYAAQFDASADVRGEASPNYAAARRFPGVPARMHAIVPAVKIIFMVRDPIERLISHWVHNFSHGREQRELADILHDDRYLERSMYATQLRPYLDVFPREQILILEMEELGARRVDTLRHVFRYLGVDASFDSSRFRLERHRTERKRRKNRAGRWLATTRFAQWVESMPQSVRWPARDLMYLLFSRRMARPSIAARDRAILIERLTPDMTEFRELTGRRFSGWSF